MTPRMNPLARLAQVALVAAALLGGCGRNPEAPAVAAASPGAVSDRAAPERAAAAASGASAATPSTTTAPSPGPAVAVSTVMAERRTLPIHVDATATVAAKALVDIRPQSAGQVREVRVREGDSVRRGQVLFVLDDRQERARLEQAQAQVMRDEAALAEAQRQLRRSLDLQQQNFLSQGAVDALQTQVQSLNAAVAASKAAVQSASVAVSWMTVTAPQDGRLGAISVHPGSTVSPTSAPLVTLTQLHPAVIVFSLPQRHVPDALKALASGQKVVELKSADEDAARVRTASAKLVFVDSGVDAASGTVRVKAEVDNRDAQWWPGAYAKVRVSLGGIAQATVVPVAAVVQGARGQSVFVVDDQDRAQVKPVEVQAISDGRAAVKGLEPGQRVVVEGRQNLRSGSRIVERGAGSGKGPASGVAPGAAPGSGAGAS